MAARRLTFHEVVTAGGGHAFHWEQAERYATLLMGFAAML